MKWNESNNQWAPVLGCKRTTECRSVLSAQFLCAVSKVDYCLAHGTACIQPQSKVSHLADEGSAHRCNFADCLFDRIVALRQAVFVLVARQKDIWSLLAQPRNVAGTR